MRRAASYANHHADRHAASVLAALAALAERGDNQRSAPDDAAGSAWWGACCGAQCCGGVGRAAWQLRGTAASPFTRPCARTRRHVERVPHVAWSGIRSGTGSAAWPSTGSASCSAASCQVRRRARRLSCRRACRVRASRGGCRSAVLPCTCTCASASRATTKATASGHTPRTSQTPAGRGGGWCAAQGGGARRLQPDCDKHCGRA